MRPHFFTANSRLGMINVPYQGTKLNIGVEDGPKAVLSEDFLRRFTSTKVTAYKFPLPEEVQKDNYTKIIAQLSKKFAEFINSNLSLQETQFVIGGDHSVSLGSLLAVLMRIKPSGVGYIQFDSHGDVHMIKTSPSGNFHGMWLRPFIDEFDDTNIAGMVPVRLKPGQIMFIGNLELEEKEKKVFKLHKIINVTSFSLAKNKQEVLSKVKRFIEKFEHIHISFDVDVFSRDFVSATGTPAENGFQPDEVFAVLDVVTRAKQKSIDLVEVNPHKKNSQATIEMAQSVLLKLTNRE